MDLIRVGRISSVNYAEGKARVVYTDRDNAVTTELPFLSHEYFMPEIDDVVYVLHLPNGREDGLILGRAWNETNKPPESGRLIYRKELSHNTGEAFVKYDGSTLTISSAGNIVIKADGTVTIEGLTVNTIQRST